MNLKNIIGAALVTFSFGFSYSKESAKSENAVTYTIDKEHTNVGFEISHLVISTVNGRFDKFEGQIKYDTAKKTIISIMGSAEANSINTNQEKRDKHLRSADFFDVEKNPKMEFLAENLNLKIGKKTKAKGWLTIHGVKKEVTIEFNFKGLVTDPWGADKIVLDAVSEINRKDFGLTWNEALETGGVMVGEKVKIIISAQGNLSK